MISLIKKYTNFELHIITEIQASMSYLNHSLIQKIMTTLKKIDLSSTHQNF